jgi:hypothetical protein
VTVRRNPLTWAIRGASAIFAASALVAFGLGWWGMAELAKQENLQLSAVDCVYHTLELFVLGSNVVDDASSIPIPLNVGRFLAPSVATYGLVLAGCAVFARRIAANRLAARTGHTIVCGPALVADPFATAARKSGVTVTVVGEEPAGSLTTGSNDWERVVGDPRLDRVLRRAGIGGALDVVVLGEDGAINGQIATAASQARTPDDATLTCYVEIPELELFHQVRGSEVGPAQPREASGRYRLQVFNREDLSARLLLSEHPIPHDDESPARILILGGGELATALIGRITTVGAPASDSIDVRVLDADPAVLRLLNLQVGRLPAHVHLTCETSDPAELKDKIGLAVMGRDETAHQPTRVYVCLEDDAAGIAASHRVSELLPSHFGLCVLVTIRAGNSSLIPAGTVVYSMDGTTPSMTQLRSGTNETLAKAIHSSYVEQAKARGETPEINPSMVDWDVLPPHLCESNRDQAWDIGRKLEQAGYTVAVGTAGERQRLSQAEVEELAVAEHDRWVAERKAAHWTAGPKDIDKKRTPYLVDWDDLDEVAKNKDRDAVRAIPELLRRAELRMNRRQ